MRRRALLNVALAGLVAMATSSCLSPTLPLPPPAPAAPDLIQAGTMPGTWLVIGRVPGDAVATVFNQTAGRGEVVRVGANGQYTVTLVGQQCDLVNVFYVPDQDFEESEHTQFTLAPFMPGDSPENPLCQVP
jgi:hypothetical protein